MGSVHGCIGEALEKRYMQRCGIVIAPRIELMLVRRHDEYGALMTRIKGWRRDHREWYKALRLGGLSCLVYQKARPMKGSLSCHKLWIQSVDHVVL